MINPEKSGGMISWPSIPCFPGRNALEISTVSLYLFLYLSLWLPCSSNISMANCFHQLLSLPSDSSFNFIGSPRVSVQTNILQHIPPLVSHSMYSITFSVFFTLLKTLSILSCILLSILWTANTVIYDYTSITTVINSLHWLLEPTSNHPFLDYSQHSYPLTSWRTAHCVLSTHWLI